MAALPLGMRTHQESGDDPWTINIPDHPARTVSAGFRAPKKLAGAILATIDADASVLSGDDVHMHRGGSLWLFDDGWFLVQNEAGIEWSAQFCTDPAKAESLRCNARRLYAGFPATIPEMIRLGYRHAEPVRRAPTGPVSRAGPPRRFTHRSQPRGARWLPATQTRPPGGRRRGQRRPA
jgi:hypothetical protein